VIAASLGDKQIVVVIRSYGCRGMGATIGDLDMLYRSRHGEFLRVATALTGDAGLGADAVQDGFARAIAHRAEFRGDAPLEAWVWRIVINAAHNARPLHPTAELTTAHDVPGPDEESDPHGIGNWLASLPERERLVVFLRYFADLDYRSIAVALDVKVGTVSATLHAAHEALRRSLEEVLRP
jgi:RNA polymerase sigma-70 factor (ECF subfamily)